MNGQYGYNCTSGGDYFELNDATKQKIARAMMNNKNGLNHPCSEEKKQKIRDAQKGKKLTEEHKQKLSEAAHNRRTPCSEEKKRILSKSYPHKKPVYCEELDTIYESVQECARELKLCATNITKVCKGKLHTTGGYHLSYYNDTINA